MSTADLAEIHQSAGSIVAEITVFICFLESYQRIQNMHLKVSISMFVAFSVLVNLFFLIGRAFLMAQNYDAAKGMFVVGSMCWVTAWLCVTYHTSYRATIIALTGVKRPWVVSIAFVVLQGALSWTGSAFFTMNFLASFGQTIDERSTKITFVESVWYSITETILFVVTQYRIVSVRSSVRKVSTGVQIQLYWKGVTRSILYSFNVIMMYLSVGNEFGVDAGGNWSGYGHAITLLILMTDSNRFQETIAILNGDTNAGKGKKTQAAASQIMSGTGLSSGANHSLSEAAHKAGTHERPSTAHRVGRANTSGNAIMDVGGGGVFGTGGAKQQLNAAHKV
ncbi:hypothetical protein BJ742DRAFT_892013 [Cladochytrium replicatum]|nr:hypothetical protein BJ742DRAFT_892013 [Cladochytrium replicatum]